MLWMFRFNPGKEQKTFPDYNPYTISRCKTCKLAKGKLSLARLYIPDNLFCSACQYLRTCYEQKYKEGFLLYRKSVIKEVSYWSGNFENLETGTLYQTRKSFKRGISHAQNIEEIGMFVEINAHISKLKHIRVSPLGENKNMSTPKDRANIQKKVDRGVTKYNVCELNINNDIWIIKTEVYKNRSEAIYNIYKKE